MPVFLVLALWLVTHGSSVEVAVLRAERRRVKVEHHVVEDLDCGIHSQSADFGACCLENVLIWVQVARLDEQLLQLEQVKVDVFVLLEEAVLIMSFLEALVLVPHIAHCSLHLLLHILDAFRRLNQLLSSLFDLSKFR